MLFHKPARRLVLACLVVVSAFLSTLLPRPAAADPATRPVTPEQAVYRSEVELAELLLDEPTDEELKTIGHTLRAEEDYARAAVIHLTALRGKRNDPELEYELACDFSQWGQKELGMKYLAKAADHGYWGYRILTEDTDLTAVKTDPAYAAAAAKIKASFAAESPKHAPDSTVKTPAGTEPAAGWPVLFFLHGWASNRHDFEQDAAYVSTLGYVGISLDATEVMGPGAYMWTSLSTGPTEDRIQAVLKSLTVKTDPKRIYLAGFSQGAMHAARLLADHPGEYAGAICNSPGSNWLLPTALVDAPHTGTIVLSVGSHDAGGIADSVDKLESLWKAADRPVHVIHFDGGHHLPPNSREMYRTALEELSGVK